MGAAEAPSLGLHPNMDCDSLLDLSQAAMPSIGKTGRE